MKVAAREAQIILRRPIAIEVVSIYGSALPTPHFLRVSSGPKYSLGPEGELPGDGVVAACCTYPATKSRKLEITRNAQPALQDYYYTHNGIIHHDQTHGWLDELLK
jgi:hypothetical protein